MNKISLEQWNDLAVRQSNRNKSKKWTFSRFLYDCRKAGIEIEELIVGASVSISKVPSVGSMKKESVGYIGTIVRIETKEGHPNVYTVKMDGSNDTFHRICRDFISPVMTANKLAFALDQERNLKNG
jgi:hypothetical protein